MGRIKRCRRWARNLSIRKSFALYVLVFSLLALSLCTILLQLFDDVQIRLYMRRETYGLAALSDGQRWMLQYGGMVMLLNVVLVCGAVLLFATTAFYRAKLKTPLSILRHAAQKIGQSDLDFRIAYDNRDEMGQLCDSFERMRACLEQNNRQMWEAVEERKRLNAAFAHDLRTPLTVLHGYADFLQTYVPQGKVTQEKLLQTLQVCTLQIERLERYVAQMNRVQRLEDVAPQRERLPAMQWMEQTQRALVMLSTPQVQVHVHPGAWAGEVYIDCMMWMEIAENLVGNACTYASTRVDVSVVLQPPWATLTVQDDGKGFSPEALSRGKQAYYRDRRDTQSKHVGLGLYICDVLCQRHGGTLTLQNSAQGGACITARLHVGRDNAQL